MSYINKVETMQAKIYRTIVNAQWYVRSENIRSNLGITMVQEVISRYAERYKARLTTHSNWLTAEMINTSNMERRLRSKHPTDLTKDIT